MGDQKDLKEAVHAMGQSAPIVAVGKGLATVGEMVQGGVDRVKRAVGYEKPQVPDPRIGRKLVNGKVVRKATSAGKAMKK